jgi:hypothetical protein
MVKCVADKLERCSLRHVSGTEGAVALERDVMHFASQECVVETFKADKEGRNGDRAAT